MKQMNVFPECNVDTNLVGYILGGYVKHKSTCNEVAKAVNKSNEFAIGIIDADKRMATLDSGFEKYDNGCEVDGENVHITMYIHSDRKRFMFTVKPAMDKFLLDAAKQLGINLRDAGYPSTLEAFKKETKRIQAAKDPKLRNLFAMIHDYEELQRFRNTLKYLMNKQYDVDIDIAKSFFDGTFTNKDLRNYLG